MQYILTLIAIVLLYLILIYPGKSTKTYKREFNRLYAHRGLFDNNLLCPENSLGAFKKAVNAGYGIELDVHVTKDKQVVVFHDDNLERMCGVGLKIEDSTYEEISKYHLLDTNEKIPLLSEVLKLIENKVPLIIEIKVLNNVMNACETISNEIEKFDCNYCIESFNPLALIWYRKNKPSVMRGQLSTNYYKDKIDGNVIKNFVLTNMMLNFLTKPDFIAYNHKYKETKSFIIVTKIMGALPVAWTVRNQEELDDLDKNFKVFIFEGFIPR